MCACWRRLLRMSMYLGAVTAVLFGCCWLVEPLESAGTQDSMYSYKGPPMSKIYTPGFDLTSAACTEDGKDVRLLVVVHSEWSHRDARDAARFTWATFGAMRNVSVVFMLGKPAGGGETLPADVVAESALYGDVVVSRNVDSFDNLPLKSVATAEWVAGECPGTRFVVKLDDDVFLNFPRLLELVQLPVVANSSRAFFGNLNEGTSPVRDKNSKYFVSTGKFPGDQYPPYLQGGAFMFTGDLARVLYSKAFEGLFFNMQDVFFTGFVSNKVQAQLTHVEGFIVQKWWQGKKWDDHSYVCDLKKKVAVHGADYETTFDMWTMIFNTKAKCGK